MLDDLVALFSFLEVGAFGLLGFAFWLLLDSVIYSRSYQVSDDLLNSR